MELAVRKQIGRKRGIEETKHRDMVLTSEGDLPIASIDDVRR